MLCTTMHHRPPQNTHITARQPQACYVDLTSEARDKQRPLQGTSSPIATKHRQSISIRQFWRLLSRLKSRHNTFYQIFDIAWCDALPVSRLLAALGCRSGSAPECFVADSPSRLRTQRPAGDWSPSRLHTNGKRFCNRTCFPVP